MNEKDEKKETEEVPNKSKDKKPKFPIMMAGAILVIVVLVVGGLVAMKSFAKPSEAAGNDSSVTGDDVSGSGSKTASTGIYFQSFDAFITVLEPSQEYRFTYLKFVPEFELSNQNVSMEIATKLPVMVSEINSIMTDLNWNTVKSEKGRERLAEKLRVKLNERLEKGEIIEVYFTTFVAQ